MNVFTTDHPLVSQPKECLPHTRIFTRKALILALMFSVITEGLCGTGCFYLPDRSSLLYLCGIFHIPGLIVAACIFADVMDDYGSKEQEFIFTCILIAVAWFQWFVIFFVTARQNRKNEHIAV